VDRLDSDVDLDPTAPHQAAHELLNLGLKEEKLGYSRVEIEKSVIDGPRLHYDLLVRLARAGAVTGHASNHLSPPPQMPKSNNYTHGSPPRQGPVWSCPECNSGDYRALQDGTHLE
jgi:hypothetical protein